MRKIIASVDIGSKTLKLVVGEFMKQKVNILAVSEVPSMGIEQGLLKDPEKFIEAIKELFKKGEEVLGINIKKVIISVNSAQTGFMLSEGYSSITNAEGIVKSMDIIRTMQGAVYNKINNQTEIAAILPMHFKIDDEEVVENPLNLPAKKLSLKSVLVMIPQKQTLPIIKCFEHIGVEVIDITVSGIADYHNIKNQENDTKVGAIINIGHDVTSISIINKGILTNTSLIEVGAKHIDYDISYVYHLEEEKANYLKETFALSNKGLASASTKETITNNEGNVITVNQYEISEIVNARLEEILKFAKKEINHLTKKEIHYIIITGGITEMSDFEKTVEDVFSKKATITKTKELGVRNNKFSVAVGLLKYYNDKMRLRNKDYSILKLEEQEILSTVGKKVNISEDSILGKLFGYFFDN